MANGIGLTLLGGVLPALFWLFFWLREDNRRPEPKWLLATVFLTGALAVVPTYLLQNLLRQFWLLDLESNSLSIVVAWALVEELVKYLVVAAIAFRSVHYDEPLDAMIYLITAALGFAAAENSLFMINLLADGGNQIGFLLNGNFRFIGATVAHVVASGVLGCFVALAFCERRRQRLLALVIGLSTATLLHTTFNYLIIKVANEELLKVFLLFWALAVIIILLFERVKHVVCRLANVPN